MLYLKLREKGDASTHASQFLILFMHMEFLVIDQWVYFNFQVITKYLDRGIYHYISLLI